ncbi:MAG: hypothetical protein JW828_09970 [Sedimentisphaerales bacterium]|nr:hypothetical protein [Sedimentisphaerales bacterium]
MDDNLHFQAKYQAYHAITTQGIPLSHGAGRWYHSIEVVRLAENRTHRNWP